MKRPLIFTILISWTSLTYGQLETPNNLDLKISSTELHVAGQPIHVTLTISNPTDSIQTIEFTETHKYHKVLPFPTCITASIKNEKGVNQCKYNSQYIVWSTLFTEDDLQYLRIEPRDKITRDLKVNEIVFDCDCHQDSGLKPGTYLISMTVHERETNEIKIIVK